MSLAVVFRETALRNLARIRGDDRAAFARVRDVIASLAEFPRPGGAVPWGTTGTYRLHVGRARILYEVDADAATVYVINVGIAEPA